MGVPDYSGPVSVDAAEIADRFTRRFGTKPRLFRAPGRINIIGEHTDYSGGFAMPAAIDRQCIVAAAPNDSDIIHAVSLTLEEEALLPSATFAREGRWSDYVGGVAAALRNGGRETRGCDLMLHSDVPLGAGVSSSAALEVALALASLASNGEEAPPADIARWAWDAEVTFVGAPCGPMDQFVAVHGRAGHALLLDCRALSATPARVPGNAAILLVNSGVRHAIVDGGYKARRDDCEAAAKLLGVDALRDADMTMLRDSALPDRLLRRAQHVVTENARALATADALARDDCETVGAMLNKSHESLRDDFDVTCRETDLLADIARGAPGVFGARQMGGGFGGCVIALVQKDLLAEAAQRIVDNYNSTCDATATWMPCALVDGAGEIQL